MISEKTKIDQKRDQMQRNCRNCVYYSTKMCGYIDIVGHRRPCPPGDECTVKRTKRGRKAKTSVTIIG